MYLSGNKNKGEADCTAVAQQYRKTRGELRFPHTIPCII